MCARAASLRSRPGWSPAPGGPGLAFAAAVLPVGLYHLDVSCGEVPGRAGSVAAGALDADQGDVAELGQPPEQAGVPGCGCGELLNARQAADRIERGGGVHPGMGVCSAGDDRSVFYDGHGRPF